MQVKPAAVLICPDEAHRNTLTRAMEARNATIAGVLTAYPAHNQLLSLVAQDCDAFVIELDTDTNCALDLVEAICSRKPSATVMVYSGNHQSDFLVASMRAGAREFLSGTIDPNVLLEALLRGAARRSEAGAKRARGKVLMFWGAKGGSGVTTLAANFAIALRQETSGEVALLDLNPQLGDVSVLLGLTPQFTIADALLNPSRLDEEFVSTLVTRHSSGVSVLAAPDVYTSSAPIEDRAVGTLVELMRGGFPYVVIDTGLGLGKCAESLFQLAGTIYLVTQADIPSLRNSQRFISYLRNFNGPEIDLVLNRFEPRKVEFDEQRLSTAVGLPPKWRVPNDYAAARRAANTGTPLIAEKSAVSQVLRQMACAACGKTPETERKKGIRLFSPEAWFPRQQMAKITQS
jgi:pilus assembly protein CpaE